MLLHIPRNSLPGKVLRRSTFVRVFVPASCVLAMRQIAQVQAGKGVGNLGAGGRMRQRNPAATKKIGREGGSERAHRGCENRPRGTTVPAKMGAGRVRAARASMLLARHPERLERTSTSTINRADRG